LPLALTDLGQWGLRTGAGVNSTDLQFLKRCERAPEWQMEQPLLEWRGTCDEATFHGMALRHYSET
ncbi:MAG TPA: hypothetical protein VGF39_14960, partial [Stellaceae bacterium]